jgi:hypothetical protein
MRRLLLGAVAASLLTLTGSATALAAHRGKRHHGTHHAARHRHRHHHATGARLLRFGVAAFNTSGAATNSADTPSDENAGTVKSFTGGVLTITLADETTVSGKVTEATRLECESATAPEGGQDDEPGDDNQGDDDNQSDEQGTSGGDEQSGATATTASNDSGDDDEQGGEACTTAALVPNAVVHEAELSVSSAGAVWEKVELVK